MTSFTRFTKFVFLFGIAMLAQGQSFTYGVRVGSPLNNPSEFSSPFFNTSQDHWTGGTSVEFHLPYRISLEFDAFYRGSHGGGSHPLTLDPATNAYLISSSQRTRAVDLPLLFKYRFLNGNFRPFIGAGFAWSHEWREDTSFASCLGPQGSCIPAGTNFGLRGGNNDSTIWRQGPAGSVGFDIDTRHVIISPELRYEHLTQPNADQFSMMVGFMFGKRERRH
jgi:hypothetical protein